MKFNLLILLCMLVLLANISCDDDDKIGFIEISGITERDISANKIGNVDESDWNLNDSWSDIEEDIFKSDNSAHNSATEQNSPGESIVVAGYPNPANEGIIYIAFQLNDNMYYDMRIVDNNLNVKVQFDSVTYNVLALNDSIFNNNQLYRLYYKIYDNDKVYRGHGDFKFIK